MKTLGQRVADRVFADLTHLQSREALAALVDAELAHESADLDVAACVICLRPFVAPPVQVGEIVLDARCAAIYRRALKEGGTVRRIVCRAAVTGGPACGVIHDVVYVAERSDSIVDESAQACTACEFPQRRDLDRRIDAMEERRSA